jgi:hypothetical protein
VPCDYCHAGVGQWCTVTRTRQPMRHGQRSHPCRAEAAAKATETARQHEISAAIATRQCTCGRDILDNADACDRCTPVTERPEPIPNENTDTA